jgi:hypothetical protein
VAKDVAFQQEDTPDNAPATEPQPSTGSIGLIQTNPPTIITNTAELGGMQIDLDVR